MDEQMKKDEDVVLHPSDNIDEDDYNDDTQVTVEEEGPNDDDDDDVEMSQEAENEVQESGMFGVLSRPSISGVKVNPLRYVCILYTISVSIM